MADIENGTQFSDLPCCLAVDILLRLPLKTLLICRYVRKDWTRLYFSDPDFIKRQLESSSIQFLFRRVLEGKRFRFGCFVDEVSTGNLRIDTLDFSCKLPHDPKHYWCVVNSCNGLVCLIDDPDGEHPHGTKDSSRVYVCNPILGESVSIQLPKRNDFYASSCALGFSAKNNLYKILLCIEIREKNKPRKYEWKIYTLGTGHWRSIETKEPIERWDYAGLDFNTFIHGSLHWTGRRRRKGPFVLQSFDFETERFTVLSLLEPESYIRDTRVAFGVINDCLWASFYGAIRFNSDGEMWAMKEYGVDKPWTMVLALRGAHQVIEYDPPDEVLLARNKDLVISHCHIQDHNLLFTLNGEEMLVCDRGYGEVMSYNIKTGRRRFIPNVSIGPVTAYNPSFVSLHDVGKGEEIISS